jgi:hypothetical protein
LVLLRVWTWLENFLGAKQVKLSIATGQAARLQGKTQESVVEKFFQQAHPSLAAAAGEEMNMERNATRFPLSILI